MGGPGRAQRGRLRGLLVYRLPPRGVRQERGREPRAQAAVRKGEAHAAVVFDGDEAVGWCQFGSPAELTRIKHRRAYEEQPPVPPDWRITCFLRRQTPPPARGRGRRAGGGARFDRR